MNDSISRQAAIDIAKDLLIKMDEYHQYNQAINNYCAELMKLPSVQHELFGNSKQLACENMNIKQAILERIDKQRADLKQDYIGDAAYRICAEFIKQMPFDQLIRDTAPPVQPERKKGKWIFLDECSNSGYYCSECNKKVVKEGWSNTVKKIKFCPNCGADMRGEQNG